MTTKIIDKAVKKKRRSQNEIVKDLGSVAIFIRSHRKLLDHTQEQLAERSGVSLNFIKALELGKKNLRMDKVNQLLNFFGAELKPILKNTRTTETHK
ncbi:MAG: helix-turn-helix transcriptional regulator [Oligoflexia bacterium]|nr:helix-turn-helix transcriptional regulator [Oligoflexia bacterium]